MLTKFRRFVDWVDDMWKKHRFEIIIVLAIILLIVIAIYPRQNVPKKENPPIVGLKRPPQESKGEKECRRVLESYYNRPFPKARPNMLRNPITSDENTDNNLELDCYNDDLKIACEYQGAQHYKYIPYFHKSRDAFQNQKYRDYMKREMCKKNGIFLIEVPYTVKLENINSYILERLQKK